MPKDDMAAEMCFITVTFPIADDAEALSVKQKIKEATKELSRVKMSFRIDDLRDMSHGNGV